MLATRFSDKTREDFTMRNAFYNADREAEYAVQPVRCVTGDAPTLAEVDDHYGRNTASEWLVPLLADMSIFTGAKNLDARQQKQLARTIAVEHQGMKVTELLLFFHRFKAGHYGRFYGAVDPMVVMCALQDFKRECREMIENHQDEVAAQWDTEARSRWTLIAEDIGKAVPDLHVGTDIYLFTTEPYHRRMLVSVASPEAADALTAHWQQWQQIADRHFPSDFGTLKVRRAYSTG